MRKLKKISIVYTSVGISTVALAIGLTLGLYGNVVQSNKLDKTGMAGSAISNINNDAKQIKNFSNLTPSKFYIPDTNLKHSAEFVLSSGIDNTYYIEEHPGSHNDPGWASYKSYLKEMNFSIKSGTLNNPVDSGDVTLQNLNGYIMLKFDNLKSNSVIQITSKKSYYISSSGNHELEPVTTTLDASVKNALAYDTKNNAYYYGKLNLKIKSTDRYNPTSPVYLEFEYIKSADVPFIINIEYTHDRAAYVAHFNVWADDKANGLSYNSFSKDLDALAWNSGEFYERTAYIGLLDLKNVKSGVAYHPGSLHIEFGAYRGIGKSALHGIKTWVLNSLEAQQEAVDVTNLDLNSLTTKTYAGYYISIGGTTCWSAKVIDSHNITPLAVFNAKPDPSNNY